MAAPSHKYRLSGESLSAEQILQLDDMLEDIYVFLAESPLGTTSESFDIDTLGELPVVNGGTGRASHTPYAVLAGGTSTTNPQQSVAGVGTTGQVLTSNGAATLPTFQDASGGSGAWTLVTSATPSGSGGIMSFNNLSAYNEILLLYRGIRGSPDFNFTSRVRVSVDNGSTYLNSSGDYVSLSAQGVETNESDMKMHGTVSGGLKTGWRTISNFNTTKPKNSWTPLDGGNYVIPTTSPCDAIQIYTSTGLDWDTVGTIYVYGRT